jgi:exopolysaccharide biosynthesis polyprenyl glycosylphosphotransferase
VKKKRLGLIMLISDAVVIALSWLIAYFMRQTLQPVFGYAINPIAHYLTAIPVIVIPWLLIAYSLGLYRRQRGITGVDEFGAVMKTSVLGGLVTMAVSYLFKEFDLGRSVVFIFIILNFILLGTSRSLFHAVEARMVRRGEAMVRALIVGAGHCGIRMLQKMQDHPEVGYKVVGFLDDDPAKQGTMVGEGKVLGRLADLKKTIISENIEEVFFAIPKMPHQDILDHVMDCEGLEVGFKIVSDLFGVLSQGAKIDLIEDFPIFDLRSGKVESGYDLLKRAFDFTMSLAALLLVAPLWGLIAVAIKLDSRGPVFFIHERSGKHGVPFKFYKFRTMRTDVGKYEIAPKKKGDARITRVGKYLREWSLDELPQLLNVLKGDMSLVGPRPEMPFIVDKYAEWQRKRLEVLPGISGLWQILGRKDLPLHENLEYDFYYIKNRSFLLDITILIKTIPSLVFGKGAY